VQKWNEAFKGSPEAESLRKDTEKYQKALDMFESILKQSAEKSADASEGVTVYSGTLFSIKRLDNGTQYVDVDVDSQIFTSASPSKYTVIAQDILKTRFKGKLFSGYYVGRNAVREYPHPSKALDETTYRAKMKASTELDNMLSIGKLAYKKPDNGTHDFASFCASGSDVTDTVRTIHRLEITSQEPFIYIDVSGSGFLYNMVRIIAGTLIDVGLKKISPEYVKEIVSGKDRNLASATAPARGLTLKEVYYMPFPSIMA
jgi:tRNA pseudouridine(38-40) synthase